MNGDTRNLGGDVDAHVCTEFMGVGAEYDYGEKGIMLRCLRTHLVYCGREQERGAGPADRFRMVLCSSRDTLQITPPLSVARCDQNPAKLSHTS